LERLVLSKRALRARLDLWQHGFVEALLSSHDTSLRHRALLRVNYLVTVLTVDAVYIPQLETNSASANYNADLDLPKLEYFYEILDLAEATVATSCRFSRYDVGAGEKEFESTGLLPLFSFRASFIQCVFYVAHKAPDIKLRWRAIHLLLEKPWREGAWDSFIMGSIAKRSLEASHPSPSSSHTHPSNALYKVWAM
jgi:hypothetical protein